MMQILNIFQRWKLVKINAITIFILLTLVMLIHGTNEESMRIAIRLTARTSCILFLLAFCASSLRKFKSHKITNWLSRNRRCLVVRIAEVSSAIGEPVISRLSMAVSHGFHALAIIGVDILSNEAIPMDNHRGNLGYFFIIAMSVTSFSYPANLIGDRSWKILHTVGMYYLWLAFIHSFAKKLPESILIYLPFVSLLIIVVLLRLIIPFVNQQYPTNNRELH